MKEHSEQRSEEQPVIRKLEHVIDINWIRIAVIAVISCLCVKYSDRIFHMVTLLLRSLRPILYGGAIAYVLNIFMKRLEKMYFPKQTKGFAARTRRPVCVFTSIILVMALIVILIVLVVPALLDSVQVLTKDIPRSYMEFQKWLVGIFENNPEIQKYIESMQVNWNTVFGKAGELLQTGIGGLFNSAFSLANIIVSFAFTGLISLIFAIYMLFGKERLRGQMKKVSNAYATEYRLDTVYRFLKLANETFTKYITGQITEAFILGSLCAAGMAILRLPYAVMVGVVVGSAALIPVMGAYIGAVIGAFLIVTVSPLKAMEFIIYLAVLQQVEGNLIYPRVVGGSIGLPGIWVLASVMVSGGLFGVPGMLIGVPMTATVYKWVQNDVNRRLYTGERSHGRRNRQSPDIQG